MTELREDTQVSTVAEPEGSETPAQKRETQANSAAATETSANNAQNDEKTDAATQEKSETDKPAEQKSEVDKATEEKDETDKASEEKSEVEEDAGAQKEPKKDDFTEYLKHEHETFTGPAREAWDAEQEARLKVQDEAERREAEAMAARAAAAKQAFLAQLAQQRNKPPPRADPAPSPDPDDLAGGWREVMRMVEPSGKQLPEKDVRQIKRLYFSLKDK